MARCYLSLLLCICTVAAVTLPPGHLHDVRDFSAASSAWGHASSSENAPNGADTIAVAPLLNQAIAAMGGKDAIDKLQRIRSHA